MTLISPKVQFQVRYFEGERLLVRTHKYKKSCTKLIHPHTKPHNQSSSEDVIDMGVTTNLHGDGGVISDVSGSENSDLGY